MLLLYAPPQFINSYFAAFLPSQLILLSIIMTIFIYLLLIWLFVRSLILAKENNG